MIDKVYYINLDHRQDRKFHIEETLKSLNIENNIIERIPAFFEPRKGASGCLKSHILTLERFLSSSNNNCLVLEDDFTVFNPDRFWESFQSLSSVQIEWDVIQLSYGSEILFDCEYPFLKKIYTAQTSVAYFLNKKYANTLLENFKESLLNQEKSYIDEHEWCLDQNWKKIQKIHNWYAFTPKLGYQAASYSDITKQHEFYGY